MKQVSGETVEKDWWLQKAEAQPGSFTSDVPLVGGLIAWLRRLWNHLFIRWMVRPLLKHQTEFNRLLVEWLHDYDARLIAQDRDLVASIRDSAELSTQLVQTNQLLRSIEVRLDQLEAALDDAGQNEPGHGP